MVQNHKTVIWNFDYVIPNVGSAVPPDGYLLSYQASTNMWIPVNVPLGINRNVHSVITPAQSPFTMLVSDDFIPVDSSTGVVTVSLPAAPALGKGYTIADQTGSAALNNITVSGNGHNISGSGTFVINSNFQSLTVVYNGLNWSVIE